MAKAKMKKISIAALDKVVKDTYIPASTVQWNGLDVQIKRSLTFIEMMEFVDSVVKTCFTAESGMYIPEAKDFAVKSNIVERYTNLSLPNNLDHRYEIIYCTDIIETVLTCVNPQQFNEIMTSIDAKINNLAQMNVEQVNKQIADLYAAFENLQKQIEQMFGGVDGEEVVAMMKALTEGSIDEHKLVEAYLAHSKTKTEA